MAAPAAGASTFDDQVTNAELIFTDLLADLNLPMAASDRITLAVRAAFPDSKIAKAFQCGRTKATAIVKDVATIVKDELFARMRTSAFTLSTDGSNDQKNKLFPVVVRTVHPESHEVHSKLLSLPVCKESATGEAIFNLLNNLLKENNVPWSNCIAFGCDNASVMTGIHKGVFSFIKKENPRIFLAGCTLHLAHLAAEKGAAKLPVSPGDLLIDIYYYFSKSSLRLQSLAEFQQMCGLDQKVILKHVPTRWLSIGRFLENWTPLKEFFREEQQKSATKSAYASSKT